MNTNEQAQCETEVTRLKAEIDRLNAYILRIKTAYRETYGHLLTRAADALCCRSPRCRGRLVQHKSDNSRRHRTEYKPLDWLSARLERRNWRNSFCRQHGCKDGQTLRHGFGC